MRRLATIALVMSLTVALVTGCSGGQSSNGTQPAEKGPIVIGSKIDTEGSLLAALIKLKLEDAGFTVTDKSQTGTTDVVRKALLTGEIDMYPEYTGSGLIFFPNQDPAVYKNPERGYETVKKLDLEKNNIIWLEPARANNTWLIALRKDSSQQENLKTMTDFAAYVNAGRAVKLAASDEFFNNADAMPAFQSTYGFSLTESQKVVLAGGNTAQTEKAVADGTDGVNFGMAYGTDGALAELGLVVLDDDKGAQLVYWPTPIIRKAVLDKYPEIADLLKPVFDSLDIQTLQGLNAKIQVGGQSPDAVADEYLRGKGLIGK